MTSTALVKEEIKRFLASNAPEVLCINGRWGVGKTYTWAKLIREAVDDGKIGLSSYSYVSLFGISSLNQFRHTIGLNAELLVGSEESSEAQERRNENWFRSQIRRIIPSLDALEALGGAIEAASALRFSFIKSHIICIDDLERRGDDLSVSDIMGLASYLREQRQCKIVFLFNFEALDERAVFEAHSEKVVDTTLEFSPTSSEAVGIAITANDEVSRQIKDRCVALGISNIRVIKKIERHVGSVQDALKKYNTAVLQQAIQTIVLLGWSVYEPKSAVPLEFLTRSNAYERQKMKLTDKETAWASLLHSYDFQSLDAFDEILLAGIKRGYYDLEALREIADDIHARLDASSKYGSFKKVRHEFFASFGDNQVEMLKKLEDTFLSNILHLRAPDLDFATRIFRELGFEAKADDLIAEYMLAHKDRSQGFYDLIEYESFGPISDPGVRKAFQARYAELGSKTDYLGLFAKQADRSNVLDEDECKILAAVAVKEYVGYFKSLKEPGALHAAIDGCLQYDRITNVSQDCKNIAKNAKEALLEIAGESKINALRVARLGI